MRPRLKTENTEKGHPSFTLGSAGGRGFTAWEDLVPLDFTLTAWMSGAPVLPGLCLCLHRLMGLNGPVLSLGISKRSILTPPSGMTLLLLSSWMPALSAHPSSDGKIQVSQSWHPGSETRHKVPKAHNGLHQDTYMHAHVCTCEHTHTNRKWGTVA